MLVTGFGDFPLRMNFDLLALLREEAVILTQTSTMLVVDTSAINSSSSGQVGGIFTFTGFGVHYDSDGAPTAGTITGLRFTQQDGTISLDLSGLNLSAAALYDVIEGVLYRGIPANPAELLLPGNDELRGTPGDDFLIDYKGHNNYFGGPGSDAISGGQGNDHIYGQSPNGGEDGGDNLGGGAGSDYIQGNAGDDVISGGEGSDRLNGGQGVDFIYGDEGNDTINGNRDADILRGNEGNDLLRGGQGNDTLYGGDGNDVLMGDRGADRLDGDGGYDIYVFGPGTSEIGATSDDIDRIGNFTFNYDHFSLGFLPEALLVGSITDANAPATVDAARAFAQSLFDGHAGDHEVAFVPFTSGQLMFWASDGGSTVDSVLSVFSTSQVSNASRISSDFEIHDFI